MYDSIFKTTKQTSILLLVVEIAIYYFVMSNHSNMSNSFLKKSIKINLLPPLFFFFNFERVNNLRYFFICHEKVYYKVVSWNHIMAE